MEGWGFSLKGFLTLSIGWGHLGPWGRQRQDRGPQAVSGLLSQVHRLPEASVHIRHTHPLPCGLLPIPFLSLQHPLSTSLDDLQVSAECCLLQEAIPDPITL